MKDLIAFVLSTKVRILTAFVLGLILVLIWHDGWLAVELGLILWVMGFAVMYVLRWVAKR
jgi:hypothetical protein